MAGTWALGAVMLEIIVLRGLFLGVETWPPVEGNVVSLWILVILVGWVFAQGWWGCGLACDGGGIGRLRMCLQFVLMMLLGGHADVGWEKERWERGMGGFSICIGPPTAAMPSHRSRVPPQ